MPPRVFISYSHADTEFATKLAKRLEREGYEFWLDRTDIQTGSHWDDEIVKGLDGSQVFMVLLSERSAASQNVKDEIGYAIDHDKQIVPLLLQPCEIPFRLRRIQYVDCTTVRYEHGINSVLDVLRSINPDAEFSIKKNIDPAALAGDVTGFLTPSLAKLGSTRMEEIRARLPETIRNLWQVITEHFKENQTALAVTSDLTMSAEDKDNQRAFALQLEKGLKKDLDFANMLFDLLADAEKNNRDVKENNITVGTIHVGGDVSGNIIIGSNNRIGDNNR